MLARSQLAWLASARFAVPEVGRQLPCRRGGGSMAASWDARGPETAGSIPRGETERTWDTPGPGRAAGVVPAGPPAGGQLCPACPHICWEQSGTHFSSHSSACTAFPHGSPRACEGRNGMTEFPGHSVPAGHAVPRDSPSVAHTHGPELLEGGPRPLLGTVNGW